MTDKNRIEIKNSNSWYFHDLLGRLLQTHGVSGSEICEGLCSVSMMSRIIAGERIPGKMMRDRLMERLGVADARNENFLAYDEHERWKCRQQIIKSIDDEEYDSAAELLEKYVENKFENNVEKQFYINMKIQIMINQGADREEIGELLKEAVLLTVPDIDNRNIGELRLSVKELDLILEYEKYMHADKLADRCEEIISYVHSADMDTQSRAKIIPKVMYYQCEAMREQESPDYHHMLKKCNQGIESLRDSAKMYYMWELLKERDLIYTQWIKHLECAGDVDKAERFRVLQRENTRWAEVIEDIYMQCGVEPQMKNNCHLYFQQAVYCINDVIRCRREMMGLSKKELSEGICDERTIGRVENHKTKIQMAIVKQIFERLNLAGEYQRVDIVTDDPDMLNVLERLVRYSNNYDYEDEAKCIDELEASIDMDIPLNRQFIKRQRASNLYGAKKIGKEEAVRRIMEALEYTICFESLMKSDELVLTVGESTCIYQLAILTGKKYINKYFDFLKQLCEQYEQSETVGEHIGRYELIMTAVASVLGNIDNFEESDALSRKIIYFSVRYRRMNVLHKNIYCIAWNYNERKLKGIAVANTFEFDKSLDKCVLLSHLTKSSHYERFYKDKINKLVR